MVDRPRLVNRSNSESRLVSRVSLVSFTRLARPVCSPIRRLGRVAAVLTAIVTGAAFVVACAAEAPSRGTKRKSTPQDPGDDFFNDDPPSIEQPLAPIVNDDAGAFGEASSRPASTTPDAGPGPIVDAGSDAGPIGKTYCEGPLKAGDLALTELMIASRAGSADDGEWVEISSTRTCWLKLEGVTVESPRGAATPNIATISAPFDLAPGGSFIVADSADPAKNHELPGKVFSWNSTDTLKNDGDSIIVKLGATVIDTTTYPSFTNLQAGRSLGFPDDCAWAVRTDWARWSLTFGAWTTGFKGTPNATNDDVACY